MQDFVACKVPFFGGTEPKLFLLKRETRKIVLVMKITAVLLLAAILQVSAKGWGQEKISLTFNNAPLEQVLNSIHSQANVEFIYRTDYVKDKKVTVNVSNASLKTVLDLCLHNQQLTYDIFGKNVSIHPEKREEGKPATNGVQFNSRPPGEIRGHVANDKGEPLVGANITVKRTGKGTITDANGNFKLSDVTTDDIIVTSYVGYQSQSVKVGNKAFVSFLLKDANNELDQVVMQAYGQTTQRFNTGNIAKVTSEEIAKQPVINPLQALQGRVAGLTVTQTSGYGSAPFKVEIRGRNNINDKFTSDPLYIIDGVPLTISEVAGGSNYAGGSPGFIQNKIGNPANGQSPFFSISPSDIESIEVLKDADATAIYGSRAANGVILITTKKGKAGKTKFNGSFNQGFSAVTRHWEMLNSDQYIQMRKEAFKNDGISMTPTNAYDLITWDNNRYTDWQKIIWGSIGKITDAQIGLSGGNNQTTFRVSSGYTRRTDITTFSGSDQRFSLSQGLGFRSVNQKFFLSFNNIYSFTQSNMVFLPGNSALLPPNGPDIYDSVGKPNYRGWKPSNYPFTNLFQPYMSKTNFLNSNLILNYELLTGLTLRSSFGYNYADNRQSAFSPISSLDPSIPNQTGSSTFGRNTNRNWIIEPQIEYVRVLAKGRVDALVGGTIQSNLTDGLSVIGSGYTSDLLLGTISNAPGKNANEYSGQYRYAAIFGRINYNWQNKYILNFSARRDGSSRFAEGKQFGNYGAIGAAWIFSQEELIKKNLSILSYGKIRGSYGTTGSDIVGDYQYLTRWSSSGTFPYSGNSVLVPTQHSNEQYHWPTNKKLEAAIDIGLMKDRISFSIAWYRNRCNDQLVSFPLATYTGFNSVTANSPANVQNMGWELNARGIVLQNKNFKWTISFNTGVNKNKLLSYPNLAQSPYFNLYAIGQPLNLVRKLHYTGVNSQTGLYTFEDRNKDGIITTNKTDSTDDRFIIDANPKFIGGLGTNFSYKGIELSLFFNLVKQKGINALYSVGATPGSINNIPVTVFNNHWQKTGDQSEFAKFTTGSDISFTNFYNSDAVYTDASYIRLSTLSIAYSLPEKFIKKIGFQSIRLLINAQNIFTITKYKGIDPETQNFGGMPPSKVVTGGISFNF
jgi:TonB-linked SusC/RagA family outer membrane protein